MFVLGSNEAGVHGAGAANYARKAFGARLGEGIAPTGRCYALPNKDRTITTLPLPKISQHADDFIAYCTRHPEKRFPLTAVGCGLAGYTPHQTAPLFEGAPGNVIFRRNSAALRPGPEAAAAFA